MKKLITFFITVCMLMILITTAAYADDVETAVENDYSVIVTLPGSYTTSDIKGISSMNALEDEDSVDSLKEGKDYDILTDKTLRINYSYLAGKELYKKAYSDWEKLIISYDDNTGDQFTVSNYNISTYEFPRNENRVYTGKKTYVTPDLPSGVDYKITYTGSSRSTIGTYSYKVQGIYPYAGSYTAAYKVIPRRPASLKATFYKTKCALKWGKVKNCSGYKLYFYVEDDGCMGGDYCVKSVKVKGKSTLSKTVKIKRSSYDYVVVKAYKVVNGKYYYSNKTIKRQ